MHFHDAYEELVRLRGGEELSVRLVRPGDRALLLDGFDSLSAESRYRRFFSAKRRLSDAELSFLTRPDGHQHFALAALTRSGERGLGVARFVRLPGEPAVAEAAVVVRDEAHRRGIGRILLTRLAAAARERGVTHFRSEILASNGPMRALAESLAPGATRRRDTDVVVVDHDLGSGGELGGSLARILQERARGGLPPLGDG